jgi:hypothetical protein
MDLLAAGYTGGTTPPADRAASIETAADQAPALEPLTEISEL